MYSFLQVAPATLLITLIQRPAPVFVPEGGGHCLAPERRRSKKIAARPESASHERDEDFSRVRQPHPPSSVELLKCAVAPSAPPSFGAASGAAASPGASVALSLAGPSASASGPASGASLVHFPAAQTCVLGQALPQEPQFAGSAAVSKHVLPHKVRPPAHAHSPSWQVVPVGHASVPASGVKLTCRVYGPSSSTASDT